MNAVTNTHTPGPWEYCPKDTPDGQPFVLSQHVNRGGNFYVAVCRVEEDARLIAAAPELLEALKNTIQSLEYWFPRRGDPQGANSEMMNKARAAIAKAEVLR